MSENRNKKGDDTNWRREWKLAAGGGTAIVAIVIIGSLAIGYVNGGEAKIYVETMISTSRYLCSAIMTATATILALMLTLLSLSLNSQADLEETHYLRVRDIAFYDMLVLSLSTVWLMLHCIPIVESQEVPEWWFPVLYWILLGMAALLSGSLVAVVVMLYMTVHDLIGKVCIAK